MKWLVVSVLGWVLVPLLALAQEKVELNTVTAVKVNGSAVEITGTKKPNFSTFTMTDPPRLVIDISEAILKGVPEETRVNNGLITGLRSANYGSETSSIARVLIGYERDVETDIQVTGNTLVVTVMDGSSPRVSRAMPTPEQPNPTASQGTLVADAQPGTQQANPATQQGTAANPSGQQGSSAQQDKAAQEKAQAEAAAAKKAEEDRRKQEALAQAETAKKAEEDRRKQEEAARVEAAKKAEDERRAQEIAAADEKKRKIEEARAEAEAKKEAEADEKKRKIEEARAEAEAKKEAEAEEKKRKAEEAEQKRLATAEEKKRKIEEAHAEAEAKKEAEAEEKKHKAEEAEQKRLAAAEEKKHRAEEESERKRLASLEEKKRKEEEARATRVASAESPKARPEPESPSAATVSGKHKILEIVGFQQQAQASRVYVRTNEPVSYKVSEGRNEIVLMLENTQIGKGNNTRALDTSFFDTAVARVDPTVGPDRTVRVSIKLKEQVSVQTRQEGNTISLEFPRPSR